MRSGLIISVLAIALLSLCAAPQLRADGIDTFTYTENVGGLVASIAWQLPSSLTIDPSNSTPDSFVIGVDSASYYLDGTLLLSFPDTFTFHDSLVGGGLDDLQGFAALFLSNDQFGQFYTGGVDNPSFNPGTYQVTNGVDGLTGTLVIATPEPSALVLLSAGLCAMLFASFRRKLFV